MWKAKGYIDVQLFIIFKSFLFRLFYLHDEMTKAEEKKLSSKLIFLSAYVPS